MHRISSITATQKEVGVTHSQRYVPKHDSHERSKDRRLSAAVQNWLGI
jgi:hypothetical protein